MAGQTTRRLIGSRREYKEPAVETGSLEPTGLSDIGGTAGSRYARHVMHQLRSMCESLRGKPMPPFSANTMHLDRWLQDALHNERTGFLSAFIDQASMIQANRHWRLVGPRSIVDRTINFLRQSEGGEGFGKLLKMTALNYYCSNFGGAVHLHRSEPVRVTYNPFDETWNWVTPSITQMYATDSTNFAPNYDYIYPYTYGGDPWTRYDFLRTVSMPSTVLRTWNVGRCALWRCIQVAQMTSAIYEHIYNIVSPDTAKGIITIKGMTGQEFLDALNGSEAVNEQDGSFRKGFGPGDDTGEIVVLADREEEIVVKYVMLSRMPEGFFLDQWVRWTLTAFSTNLGFPLEEFIGMPSSRLLGSSGAEVEAGQSRGSTKGEGEFIAQLQEGLQSHVMPRTVHFEFAGRDDEVEMTETTILANKIAALVKLFEATQPAIIVRGESEFDQLQDTVLEAKARGTHIINHDEARQLAQDWGIFPAWLSSNDSNDISVDDSFGSITTLRVREKREQAMAYAEIRTLMDMPVGEPVVEYSHWTNKETGLVNEQYTTLWDDDSELSRRTNWQVDASVKAAIGTPLTRDTLGSEFQQRATKVTLADALDGEPLRAFRNTLRKLFRAQRNSRAAATSILGQRDQEVLISRLYAAAQLGRDNVATGRKIGRDATLQLSGELLDYATERVKFLLSGGAESSGTSPDDPALENSIDVETFSLMDGACPEGTDPADCARVIDGRISSRVAFVGEFEMARAYSAGQILTGRKIGARRKKWLATLHSESPREIHVATVGETVPFDELFSNGEFWSQSLPRCACGIEVVF